MKIPDKSTNEQVLNIVKERLDMGQKKYGQDIPLNGEGGRDNLVESIEEMIDLVVYLAAVLLETKTKRDEERQYNRKTVQPDELEFIFKGLKMLSNEAFEENQVQYGHKVKEFIKTMKESCNWDESDEEKLEDRNGEFVKCIPGSNCD